MSLLRDLSAPYGGLNPGVTDLEDSGSLLTHLKTKQMSAAKYLARHFVSIRQAPEAGGLAIAYWLAGMGNPANGLTILRLLESGHFNPGLLRPLKSVASKEGECRR